ncbi:HCP-like protein [Backusella circina FSU 941]|nr:HCP-like protein [Backusella circina FSU 941]
MNRTQYQPNIPEQHSFDYVIPNSRIVPPPNSEHFTLLPSQRRQPARMESLQKTSLLERESLVDPSTFPQSDYGYSRETYIEPNIATLTIESPYPNTQHYIPKTPLQPIYNNNNNYQNENENIYSQPLSRPEIRTMKPPTAVKASIQEPSPIHMKRAYITTPEPSVAVYESNVLSTPSTSIQQHDTSYSNGFKLPPSTTTSSSTTQEHHYIHHNHHSHKGPPARLSSSVSASSKQNKPPLTPLVIPASPVRSTSSPNRTMWTPTRSSSMNESPLQLPTPGLITPNSVRSPNSPFGSSPLTSSPLTPTPNTLLNTMFPPNKKMTGNSSAKKQSLKPTGEAERLVHEGIKQHEMGKLEQATELFKQASIMELPIAMFLYGVSLRHGWGCTKNEPMAFLYLQKAAEHAVTDLSDLSKTVNLSASKGELIMSIYELGVSFRYGWGCRKNKETAVYYFKIAADLGDADAQNDLGYCYHHGQGTKKDLHLAAKYYRMADKQGQGIMGNSWIWKTKYDKPSSK